MELLIDRVAGVDVHKRSVTACVRTPGPTATERREVKRTFLTFHDSLVELRDWIVSEGVTEVVMEATGVFWKPVWFVLEGHVALRLVNARHVKMVPVPKTDLGDAAWLAQLLEVGLLRASFVP
jgi:transposase